MNLVVDKSGDGQRLDRYLAARLPRVSRSLIMKYLKEGAARVNRSRAKPGLALRAGDEIDLPDFEAAVERIRGGVAAGLPEVAAPRGRPEGIEVLFEDEFLVAVNKPAGLVMHPGKGHEEEGLDEILRAHFGPSTRLVHRIDKDTSGVVIAARGHPESARRMSEAFRSGDTLKTYLALVRGVPSSDRGVIEEPLLDSKEEGARVFVDPFGKPSRTDYEVLERFPGYAWLCARPKTGRRHQIRVHLAHLGHPLAVDHVYARRGRLRLRELRPDLPPSWKNPVVLARQPLHAAEITFRHPRSGEDMTLRAPLPADLEKVLELLRG